VEAFCRAATTGHLQPRAEPRAEWVVLVEEAAMMDTHRMAALLEAAGQASIRTVGDPEHAQPVGAGAGTSSSTRSSAATPSSPR
jgi:ATP-dependent exoDNAse (exonuclease V) alpha subunit